MHLPASVTEGGVGETVGAAVVCVGEAVVGEAVGETVAPAPRPRLVELEGPYVWALRKKETSRLTPTAYSHFRKRQNPGVVNVRTCHSGSEQRAKEGRL